MQEYSTAMLCGHMQSTFHIDSRYCHIYKPRISDPVLLFWVSPNVRQSSLVIDQANSEIGRRKSERNISGKREWLRTAIDCTAPGGQKNFQAALGWNKQSLERLLKWIKDGNWLKQRLIGAWVAAFSSALVDEYFDPALAITAASAYKCKRPSTQFGLLWLWVSLFRTDAARATYRVNS